MPSVLSLLALAACASFASPAAAAIVAQDVDFGSEQADNALIAFEDVVVTNDGMDPVTIGTPSLAGADPEQFDLDATKCEGATIAPAATCTLTVFFMPTVAGSFTAVVSIPNDGPTDPATFNLTGMATPTPQGILVPNPADVAFGAVQPGGGVVKSLELTNSDPSFAPTVGQAAIHGTGFSTDSDQCSRFVLLPGASCTVAIVFAPTGPGLAYNDVLEVPANTGTLGIPLTGSGASPEPSPSQPAPPTPPQTQPPARVVLDKGTVKRTLKARALRAVAGLKKRGLLRKGLLVRGIEVGQPGMLRGTLRAKGRTLGAVRLKGGATMRIRLTKTGRKLLQKANRVRLQLVLAFAADAGGGQVRVAVSKTIRG